MVYKDGISNGMDKAFCIVIDSSRILKQCNGVRWPPLASEGVAIETPSTVNLIVSHVVNN